ncbi:class I SAM-dependent methyltransferase [Burkholderia oklahomensis]|uniref:Methyltransferase domain protein n=1 Tax=Burkholderia oklahomensis TaxID=342113 RepID=A0AAI8BAZ1_9BURK|nr:class I SAM-dependent methyltransferase [Burkholderia oklahomensis]AIO69483.1 methyltransferase domain protein [Burkholderia oklahomensis]QPS40970.1 class I SAM-dependent methyltransferase [Burkholderia oklahomensis]
MLEQTAEHWGQRYFSQTFNRREWQAHPLTIQRQYELQGNLMREEWFFSRYLDRKPIRRAASLGAGRAETEIALLELGAVEHFDLFDVSPVGIEYAKARAEEKGFGHKITCHVGPISRANLNENTYDLITFIASLHHMQPLSETLQHANRALTSRGIIWCANEYIGPDRFAYPATHAAIAKSFFLQIPPTLRNHWHQELQFPTPKQVAEADPTEAPCSSKIEPTMHRMFPTLDIMPLYGAFAFMVFWGLNHDALYETPEGTELTRFILGMDRALTDAGILPTYFAHIVARKNGDRQQRAFRPGIDPDSSLYNFARRAKSIFRPLKIR